MPLFVVLLMEGVDPRLTPNMVAQMDHLLGELRLKAIKIHPPINCST